MFIERNISVTPEAFEAEAGIHSKTKNMISQSEVYKAMLI